MSSIDKRIAGISEADAKAALRYFVERWAGIQKGTYEFTTGFAAGKTGLEYWRHRALDLAIQEGTK